MKRFFQNIALWLYLKVHTTLIDIGIVLYRSEQDLSAGYLDVQESDKKIIRKRHPNATLEKFYAGKTDEKYVQEYYEILKKADKFIKTATPNDFAIASDKHLRFQGDSAEENRANKKDASGRRYEHYGFFDEKHKHAGKTVGEVLEAEMKERRTNDDDFELLTIFNNTPIETGFNKIFDVIEKTDKENVDFEYEVVDLLRKSKSFEFPIKATHSNPDIPNKIEQLSEFLHVKKIGFEHRQLEFFIPLKFKTAEVTEESDIFKQLSDIKEIFIRDEYGKLVAFGVTKFMKRIMYNDTHEVWKFHGIEMQQMGVV